MIKRFAIVSSCCRLFDALLLFAVLLIFVLFSRFIYSLIAQLFQYMFSFISFIPLYLKEIITELIVSGKIDYVLDDIHQLPMVKYI